MCTENEGEFWGGKTIGWLSRGHNRFQKAFFPPFQLSLCFPLKESRVASTFEPVGELHSNILTVLLHTVRFGYNIWMCEYECVCCVWTVRSVQVQDQPQTGFTHSWAHVPFFLFHSLSAARLFTAKFMLQVKKIILHHETLEACMQHWGQFGACWPLSYFTLPGTLWTFLSISSWMSKSPNWGDFPSC